MSAVLWSGLLAVVVARPIPASELARKVGVKGGLCVYVPAEGSASADLLARIGALGGQERARLLHVLVRDASALRPLRQRLQEEGVYGRVSVGLWRGGPLPYDDNLVDLLVVGEARLVEEGQPTLAEIARVLRPGGTACLRIGGGLQGRIKEAGFTRVRTFGGWLLAERGRPTGMDEWPFWRHGPDRNAVSRDLLVGPPGSLRWLAGPGWPRWHPGGPKGFAIAGGRFFVLLDEATPYTLGPARFRLIARNAYNGLLLWKRTVRRVIRGRGQVVVGGWLHPIVATPDKVYTVLDRDGLLVALDAATGKTLRTYTDAGTPTQILPADGKLVLTGGGPVRLLDTESGRVLWEAPEEGCWPLVADGRLFYRIGYTIVCRDLTTGHQRWRTDLKSFTSERAEPCGYYRGVLFLAVAYGGKAVYALSAETGRLLWSYTYFHPGHGGSKKNVFGLDGLVWVHEVRPPVGQNRPKRDHRGRLLLTYALVGLDPRTGEVKRTLEYLRPGGPRKTPQRCHLDIATTRYYITGSLEFVEFATGRLYSLSVARGACDSGFAVAEGLFYTFPHPCACRPFLRGFAAFVPARPTSRRGRMEPQDEHPLVRGPAFGKASVEGRFDPQDWPTWRHDPARSASTPARCPLPMAIKWRRKLPGGLTAPTIARGSLFLAAPDRSQVIALDLDTGRVRWTRTVGGPVDTPPTIAGGMCLFGSADGWVYALRVEDGEMVWRFRAAPRERLIIDHGRLTSAWPVHGTVLVEEGKVFCAAGRHSALDGGVRLFALEVGTGKPIWKRVLSNPPDRREGLNDVLVSDGRSIYLYYHWKVDPATGTDSGAARKPHLRPAPGMGGLLEGLWSRRSYGGPRQSDHYSVAGELVAFAPDVSLAVLGFSRGGRDVRFVPGKSRFRLIARRGRRETVWAVDLPVRARALVRAGKVVLTAGPVNPIDPRLENISDRRRITAILSRSPELLEPRESKLVAYDLETGRLVDEANLPAPPVDEGMAVARGKVVVSLRDGTVVCLGRR